MSKIYPPIYIAGPTASGKSALAVKLAEIFDSVIISADSMQIYRTLDIGTAKEDPSVRARIPHKLIDVVNPSDEFSVAEFARMAKIEIEKAQNEGKLPIVVGGTGLYFEALLYPMSFSHTNKNEELRANLQDELQRIGAHAMHEKLANLDPETANRLHENDTKRVIRALEIVLSTGKPLSQTQDERETPDVIMVALNTDRQALYERINARVDKMFEQGLVQEVLSVGDFSYQSMQAIGYKEFADCKFTIENGKFVVDQSELDQIKDKIKQHSRNYAKRQLTWFRKYDFVKWFDIGDQDGAIGYISEKIREKYHSEFGLDGVAVPVASSRIARDPDVSSFLRGPFTYMGNLESGRDEALYAFAQALAKADKKEKVLVYSKDYEKAKKCLPSPNIEWMAPLPYDQLPEIEAKAGALISCEGFSQENIDKVRYSLSTKVGDCLRSGKVLLSLGPTGAGSVDYLKEKDAALFCTSLNAMDQFIEDMYTKTEEELLALVQRELQAGMDFDLKTNAEKVRDYLLGLVRKSGE